MGAPPPGGAEAEKEEEQERAPPPGGAFGAPPPGAREGREKGEEKPTPEEEAAKRRAEAIAKQKEAAIGWEHEVKPSKYADGLVQLPPHKPISPDPSTWVCEESGMRENLWLNLSDGHIGSGRRQWDGSGGTNGETEHHLSP